MAKSRIINTKFWSDNWVRKIKWQHRYLFLYFLTNEHTNISGVYELPLDIMSFETGFTEKELAEKYLLEIQPKVFYLHGWIYIPNFQKHQSSTSQSVQKGIQVEMSKIPEKIKEEMKLVDTLDTLSLPYRDGGIYINTNININTNTIRIVGKPTPAIIKKEEKNNLPFSLKEEITKLENSTRRDLNIIALFFEYRKPEILNREQYEVALKRHLKPAKDLVPFTDEQIIKAIEYAKKEYAEIYTLETLIKIITK